ncbi:MAG: glycyl-radical enzyme activating protein [Ruminococcaceae bacterium]|nr:glycyl-radical enzyme activating protein [Oscillospiraceae bacterium]
MDPFVFDIKRTSTVDGPGIRTTVFFKGCNLNCFWCHNPEGKAPEAQLGFFAEKCISCGVCKKICEHPEKCIICGACVRNCPAEARKLYGKRYSVDELYRIILSDKDYYFATGGGVTFSGGECMLYPEFIAELAKKCTNSGIHVAVDTAGNVPWDHFEKILEYVDCFLYDIKALDSDLHKSGTGVGNGLILDNLDRLIQTGRSVIIRTPVIPGYNDGAEKDRISSYCSARGLKHELLEYHAIAESKKAAVEALL